MKPTVHGEKMSESVLADVKTIVCHGRTGMTILVDAEDYPVLSRLKWYPQRVRQSEKFYATRRLQGGGSELMHQLLMGIPPQGMVVDHINDNGLDNRKENLRFLLNSENIRRRYEGTDTGLKFSDRNMTNPWIAQISFGGKTRHVGYFPTKEAAREARDEALEELLKG